jgi:hypothetical protein
MTVLDEIWTRIVGMCEEEGMKGTDIASYSRNAYKDSAENYQSI